MRNSRLIGAGLLVALVIATPGAQGRAAASDGERVASVPSLKTLAKASRVRVGAAVNGRALAAGDARYAASAAENFNILTTEGEMRWAYTEPRPGAYDFSAGDAVVAFAQANGMAVRGHNLVWFDENPAWLEHGQFSRAELTEILRQHITAEVTHFRGKVAQWDVVNEPLDSSGQLRDSIWLRVIGPSYVAKAFQWAHEADPNAQLFINEYGLETPGPKLDAMVSLVRDLKEQGVAVGGVGFQGHFGLTGALSQSTGDQLAASMARFKTLGVATAVTELDVSLPEPPTPQQLATQAIVYRNVLKACIATASCKTVVVWGVDDGHSWVPRYSPGKGAATLLDASYKPKPAYGEWTRLLTQTPPPKPKPTPANDRFASATKLMSKKGTFTGSTVGAGVEKGENVFKGNRRAASVWFAWKAKKSGKVRFSARGGFAPYLAVATGSRLSSLRVLKSDTSGAVAEVKVKVKKGKTYRIVLDGGSGSYTLSWK